MMTRRQFLGAGSALVAAACAPVVSGLYDSAPLDDPVLGRCAYSGRFPGSWIYEESDYIRAFFEPGDLALYRQTIPSPLVMPERLVSRLVDEAWECVRVQRRQRDLQRRCWLQEVGRASCRERV